MPKNVFIKPRLIDDKPAIVRDPDTRIALKAEGEWKLKNQFWTRRILQGDVVDETEKQLAAQKAPAKAQAKSAAPSQETPTAAPAATSAEPVPAAKSSK